MDNCGGAAWDKVGKILSVLLVCWHEGPTSTLYSRFSKAIAWNASQLNASRCVQEILRVRKQIGDILSTLNKQMG